jgi:hypothetical protein
MNFKDKWTRLILITVLGLFLTFSTASCAMMDSLFEDKVVTTEDNVKDEFKHTMVPAPLEGVVSKEVQDKMKADGKTPIIVDKGAVKNPELAVEVLNPSKEGFAGLVGVGLNVANTVWPGVAFLEGLGLLFSQRKRQHYTDAVKAITPYDGDVAVKEAIVSVTRAMGLAHSSDASKEAVLAERGSKAIVG